MEKYFDKVNWMKINEDRIEKAMINHDLSHFRGCAKKKYGKRRLMGFIDNVCPVQMKCLRKKQYRESFAL